MAISSHQHTWSISQNVTNCFRNSDRKINVQQEPRQALELLGLKAAATGALGFGMRKDTWQGPGDAGLAWRGRCWNPGARARLREHETPHLEAPPGGEAWNGMQGKVAWRREGISYVKTRAHQEMERRPNCDPQGQPPAAVITTGPPVGPPAGCGAKTHGHRTTKDGHLASQRTHKNGSLTWESFPPRWSLRRQT